MKAQETDVATAVSEVLSLLPGLASWWITDCGICCGVTCDCHFDRRGVDYRSSAWAWAVHAVDGDIRARWIDDALPKMMA